MRIKSLIKYKILMSSINNLFKLSLVFTFCAFTLISCGDDDLDRDQFIGSYSVVDDCDDPYILTISASTGDDDEITIFNLWDWDENMTASVSGNNLTIATQDSDGSTFSGSGSISGNTLTINYNVDGDDCTAVCTKQ